MVLVTGFIMASKKRKALSQKVRFEVFKRDSFTCQYCGRKAPDVVLHVDHIEPVAGGGTNDMLNLITSCSVCNVGKGATALSDDSAAVARRSEAEYRQARVEQLKMIQQWHKDASDLFEQSCMAVEELMMSQSFMKGLALNDHARNEIRQIIRRFGVEETLAATGISLTRYIEVENGTATPASFNLAFDKIGGICFNRKQRRERGDNARR